MARSDRPVLRPSILDRLDSRSGFGSDYGSVSEYRRAVLRDVEWLLNNRQTIEPAPEALEELQNSVYHYGLPDLTSLSADSIHVRGQVRRAVEDAIRLFEPRLRSVRVRIPQEQEEGSRKVRFVIEGLLQMDPHPEHVMFDTVLESGSGNFKVTGHA